MPPPNASRLVRVVVQPISHSNHESEQSLGIPCETEFVKEYLEIERKSPTNRVGH